MKLITNGRLALGLLVVLATMALGAGTASADYLEVKDADTGEPCGTVSSSAGIISGGCALKLEGPFKAVTKYGSITTPVGYCQIVLSGAISTSGELFIGTLQQDGAPSESYLEGGGECGVSWDLQELPWEGHVEAVGSGAFVAHTEFAHSMGGMRSGEATFELEEREANMWAFDTNGFEHLAFSQYGHDYGIEADMSPAGDVSVPIEISEVVE